jgi:ERCC4-type nuclease
MDLNMRKSLELSRITVIADSREQNPFDLSPLKTVQGSLTTGDYSILGLEHEVAIERKSLQDLIGCVGRERERFDREVKRLLGYPVRAVICEGSYGQIEAKAYRGSVHPNAVAGSIIGWCASGVPVIMAGTRARAQEIAVRMLVIAAKRRYAELVKFEEAVA